MNKSLSNNDDVLMDNLFFELIQVSTGRRDKEMNNCKLYGGTIQYARHLKPFDITKGGNASNKCRKSSILLGFRKKSRIFAENLQISGLNI